MKKTNCSRRHFLKSLAVGSGLLLVRCTPKTTTSKWQPSHDMSEHYWGYAIDTTRCIGCCACMRACRAENDVPAGYYRTWVERYRINPDGEINVDVSTDEYPSFHEVEGEVTRAFFVPKLCNQCEKSVCTQVCPVGASYHTEDGAVLVDGRHCIGCGYCVQACPYGCRFINPETHVADKCTLCYHRITRDMEPACVMACPKGARIFGDLKDPNSKLSVLLKQHSYQVLKPEMGTQPKCYYQGLGQEVV